MIYDKIAIKGMQSNTFNLHSLTQKTEFNVIDIIDSNPNPKPNVSILGFEGL